MNFISMNFISIIFIVSLVLAQTMAAQNYEGSYRLTKVIDENMGEIPIPTGDFIFRMNPSNADANQYNLGIKLGNSMGASATVSDLDNENSSEDTISIRGVRSTMMMPPPEIFRIETAMSDLLPSVTTINLENDVLTLKGSKGIIEATRKV
jgi:META domain